jgi:hypothetical protein
MKSTFNGFQVILYLLVRKDLTSIDAHGLKIQVRGHLKFLPKDFKALRKLCQGVPLFWVLLHFY